jgi:hypothetical protein
VDWRKSAGGLAADRKSERGKQRERRTYVLRGLVRCGVCQLDVAEVYAMIDSLGDVGATLAEAKPTALNRLYREQDAADGGAGGRGDAGFRPAEDIGGEQVAAPAAGDHDDIAQQQPRPPPADQCERPAAQRDVEEHLPHEPLPAAA